MGSHPLLGLLLLPPAVPGWRLDPCRDQEGARLAGTWAASHRGWSRAWLPRLPVGDRMTPEDALGRRSDQGGEAPCTPQTGSAQELDFQPTPPQASQRDSVVPQPPWAGPSAGVPGAEPRRPPVLARGRPSGCWALGSGLRAEERLESSREADRNQRSRHTSNPHEQTAPRPGVPGDQGGFPEEVTVQSPGEAGQQ